MHESFYFLHENWQTGGVERIIYNKKAFEAQKEKGLPNKSKWDRKST